MKTILKVILALSLVSSVAFAIENEENNFKKKLANYAKKYKVSKEFYEKFKSEKMPLILYFTDDLIKRLNDDELEKYENYTRHFEAQEEQEECKDKVLFKNGMIVLFLEPGTCYTVGGNTYLIFSCKNDDCEIIDIGEESCEYGGCDYEYFSWLKK